MGHHVVVLTPAGASAAAFRCWAGWLPADVTWQVEQPAHLAHRATTEEADGQPATLAGAARQLLRELARDMPDRKVVLVGHSLGGVLAHEVARSAPAQVAHLVLLAVRPPHDTGAAQFATALQGSDEELLVSLDRLGALSSTLRDSPFRQAFTGPLRSDLTLLCAYRLDAPACAATPLPLPTTVWTGACDPLVPLRLGAQWAPYVAGQLHLRHHPGDHFFPLADATVCRSVAELAGTARTDRPLGTATRLG